MSKKKNEKDFAKEVKKIADDISINRGDDLDEQHMKDFEEIHHAMNHIVNMLGLEEISSKERSPLAVWYDLLNSAVMHVMMRTEKAYVKDVLGEIVNNIDFLDEWNEDRINSGQMECIPKEAVEALYEDNDEETRH